MTEDESCVICLDNLSTSNSVSIDSCRHQYHILCIEAWGKISSQCPLCKKDFQKIISPDGVEIPIEKKKFKGESDTIWDETQDWLCQICGSGEHEEVLLICEQCEKCCHTYCADLDEVPDEPYFCIFCVPSTENTASMERSQENSHHPVAASCPESSSRRSTPSSPIVSNTRITVTRKLHRPMSCLSSRASSYTKMRPPYSNHSICAPRPNRLRFDRHRIHILIRRRLAREGITVNNMSSPLTRPVIPKSDGIIEQSTIDQLIGLRPRIETNPWVYTKERKHNLKLNPLQYSPSLTTNRSKSRSRSNSPNGYLVPKRRKYGLKSPADTVFIRNANIMPRYQAKESSSLTQNCSPLQSSIQSKVLYSAPTTPNQALSFEYSKTPNKQLEPVAQSGFVLATTETK